MTHPWLSKTEYPFESNNFEINGYKLHYIDEGIGENLLFIHGTPSWSFDFRNVIKRLASNSRCLAIDHIGFGLSDKPKHYDYSTQNHSKTLEKFILEKDLKDLTLVVHDFGGIIGLNFAIQYPERIKGLVILNSWMWSAKDDPDFINFSKILRSPFLPFLYRYLNFSPRCILPRSFGERKLSKELLPFYTKPFANSSQRSGPLAFAHSLLNDQDWFETLWSKREAISGKPAVFIWGLKDPIITPKYLSKFQSGFSRSSTICLDTCGHFPQEEFPEVVADAIQDFMKEN